MTGTGWEYRREFDYDKHSSASRERQTWCFVSSRSKVTSSFQQAYLTNEILTARLVSNIRDCYFQYEGRSIMRQFAKSAVDKGKTDRHWSVTESALRGGSTRTEPTASSPTLGDPLIISLPLHLASSRSSSSSPYIINLLRRSKREVTLCNCDAFVEREVVYINDIVILI